MKRRYCEEHDDLANTDAFAEGRVCHYWGWQVSLEHEYGKNDDDPLQPCRMVPMRLIPDNAETLDREVLAAALGRVVELEQPASWSEDQWQDLAIVEDAALEYLTQLPEQCATCGGSGHWTNRGATEREFLEGLKEEPCPTCHGSGLIAALDGETL